MNIHEAKTHLSRLLQRVAEGEEITIARAGVPVAKLVAVDKKKKCGRWAFARGQDMDRDDFDAPLPDDLLAEFYGEVPRKPARPKREENEVLAGHGVWLWSLNAPVAHVTHEGRRVLERGETGNLPLRCYSWEIASRCAWEGCISPDHRHYMFHDA